jgi:hypothetical protein
LYDATWAHLKPISSLTHQRVCGERRSLASLRRRALRRLRRRLGLRGDACLHLNVTQ